MFKKGKKKETTKFDQDLHGLQEEEKADETGENGSHNLSEKVQNLFPLVFDRKFLNSFLFQTKQLSLLTNFSR